MVDREKAMNKVLSSGPQEHERKVTQLQEELRAATKSRKGLLNELGALVAERLVVQWNTEHPKMLIHHRDDPQTEVLEAIGQAVLAQCPEARILLTAPANPPPFPADQPVGGSFYLLAGPQGSEWVQRAGSKIAEVMGGRGGGRGPRYQGKVQDIRQRVAILGALEAAGL
eukprot:GAFH01005596.1.p2 GENE.GAFH01005596.1~~GAFH01005596.1.p2  ORF type:complete len:177 (-),score=55.09 GAFH01005596.1:92-601(-)